MKKTNIKFPATVLMSAKALLILLTCYWINISQVVASARPPVITPNGSQHSKSIQANTPKETGRKMKLINKLEKRIMKKLDVKRSGEGGKFLLMVLMMMIFLILGVLTLEIPLLGLLMLCLSVACFLLSIQFFVQWITYL